VKTGRTCQTEGRTTLYKVVPVVSNGGKKRRERRREDRERGQSIARNLPHGSNIRLESRHSGESISCLKAERGGVCEGQVRRRNAGGAGGVGCPRRLQMGLNLSRPKGAEIGTFSEFQSCSCIVKDVKKNEGNLVQMGRREEEFAPGEGITKGSGEEVI